MELSGYRVGLEVNVSVILGELIGPASHCDVEVSAPDYGADTLWLEQGRDQIELNQKQLQELSKIIDRFLDR